MRTIDNLTTGSMVNLARSGSEVDFRAVDIRDLERLTELFEMFLSFSNTPGCLLYPVALKN